MSDRDTRALIEAVLTPYRDRDAEGRILTPPAWWDLPPETLDELFTEQLLVREIERAVHGESGTVQAVMLRVLGT